MQTRSFHQLLNLARSPKARQKRGQSGFTLVELLIVVVIIGILSAVGIPAYLNQANKARQNAAKGAASDAARSCAAALAAGDTWAVPSGIQPTTCATGTTFTFTSSGSTYQGKATIDANGAVGEATN